MTDTQDIHERINSLLKAPHYTLSMIEKDQALLPYYKALGTYLIQTCEPYRRFITSTRSMPEDWQSIHDIPPLPVSMFKHFRLSTITEDKIVRELKSSSTSGQTPSRILIDKVTAFRQSRALVSILKNHLGGAQRRPFLVLDTEDVVQPGTELTARGAAIRGIGAFGHPTYFAMTSDDNGGLTPDVKLIESFFEQYKDQEILIFGFTYIVWLHFLQEMEKRAIKFNAPHARMLHGGGWKKLQSSSVSKLIFNERVANVIGTNPSHIMDYYGMIEQVGIVFVDCENGLKHAPAFCDVVIRDPLTMKPLGIGEEGLIQITSLLPTSYPGLALLTEDQGVIEHIDDCPCGRKGVAFRFTRRVEKTETRGCGDTYAKARSV